MPALPRRQRRLRQPCLRVGSINVNGLTPPRASSLGSALRGQFDVVLLQECRLN